ncbi:low affinity iron permease family protein [Robbsia sp. KACC 23696]|uniref:low affinity iron permease family protein n=1 Tax=Robbsia sp. KACC 23696 TaxID=3149231 RepID=UPI00325BC5FC
MKLNEKTAKERGFETVSTTADTSFAATHPVVRAFDRFASAVTRWTGSPVVFCSAILLVIVWAITGPVFHYSNGWQLVINTGTTIVTFLMVFLIQQSQNKDSIAVHLKLNELIASHRAADNQLIGIEDAPEQSLRKLAAYYADLADLAEKGAKKPETMQGHVADLLREDADRKIIVKDEPI